MFICGIFRGSPNWDWLLVVAGIALIGALIGGIEEKKGRKREWAGLLVFIGIFFIARLSWVPIAEPLTTGGMFLFVFATVSLVFNASKNQKQASKAPEPTPTAVTPPAGQEARQP